MSDNTPMVSVIMNCFNGALYLREAIDSIVSQTYPNWEIVFYDNASTDGSGQIACGYGERIRYFRGESTIPLGAARNVALTHARGDLIAFLDTDDCWLPEKLEWQISAFQENPGAAFIYSNVYILNASTGKKWLSYSKAQLSGMVFRSFLRYYPVNLQTVMLRRASLMKMEELFDPALEVSEEFDLFMRLLIKEKAYYLDRPTAIYRVHSGMASIKRNARYPVENELVLEKLRKAIPTLEQDYPDEVRYFKAKIAYWYAVVHMANGESVQAREKLKPHKMVAPEFLVLFLATYFPLLVWRSLLAMKTTLGVR